MRQLLVRCSSPKNGPLNQAREATLWVRWCSLATDWIKTVAEARKELAEDLPTQPLFAACGGPLRPPSLFLALPFFTVIYRAQVEAASRRQPLNEKLTGDLPRLWSCAVASAGDELA